MPWLSRPLRLTSLSLANLLIPLAVLVFASGFFPYKPVLPGLASWEAEDGPSDSLWGGVRGDGFDESRAESAGKDIRGDAPFDKVVFMVVDALRSDFVFGEGSGMSYTQSLIRTGAAIPFTAHASPPTVTMPRVKALTTGSVPSFLDLILNFAESDTSSSLASQDTWLAQLRTTVQRNLVFYGDDTWLKLFPPPFFARSEGTSSFFVSDFTEVDTNVTRHLPHELQQKDWNALVLHYLGLDHIGHKTGPMGPNMLPKQVEMDGIVQMIYAALEREAHLRNTLLVVAGDHGMNAGGNHGGSGPGETEPALVFVSRKFKGASGASGGDGASGGKRRQYECPTNPKEGTDFHFYEKVQQSDVVPTLAGLMGFPVPKNSLGVFIEAMGGVVGGDLQAVRILRRNARQMLKIVEAAFGEAAFRNKVGEYEGQFVAGRRTNCTATPDEEHGLACKYAKTLITTGESQPEELAALKDFLYTTQDALSSTASSYNLTRMDIGTILAILSLILAILAFPSLWPPTLTGTALATVCLLYGVMMFASSYVEEEQHFWYWLTPAWLALLAARELRSESTLNLVSTISVPRAVLALPVMVCHRVMVRWNQTGQKWTGEPDVVHTFFPEHHYVMWLFVLATYLTVAWQMARVSFAGIMMREAAVSTTLVMVLAAVLFKLNFTQADAPELVLGLGKGIREFTEELGLVVQARVVFTVVGLAAGLVVVGTLALRWLRRRESNMKQAPLPTLAGRLRPLLTLFLITQTRAPNVPLFLILELQLALLSITLPPSRAKDTHSNTLPTALTTLILSHTTFFAFGGSNSISSVDLSNAYNGVSDYNILAVGLLLFASNWAGAVWWCSAAVTLLLPRSSSQGKKVAFSTDKEEKERLRPWVAAERLALDHSVATPKKKATTAAGERQGGGDGWALYVTAMTAFVAASLVAVLAACTALRTHLFIWTVFSPKYLYAMAWAVGWHLGVTVGIGGLLWLLGGVR